MRISLTLKWVLTLLISSLTGVALVGFFAYWATITEFDRFINENAEQDFVDDATRYYERYDGWQGIDEYLHEVQLNEDIQEGENDDFRPLLYVVVNTDYVVLSGAGPFKPGDTIPPDLLDTLIPLVLDDAIIGYALNAAPPGGLAPHEREYLENTNRALIAGVIGASGISILVGLLLSRQFLHPLTDLTQAILAMKSGDLHQQVTVKTNDELGQLADTFNQMSSELHRANQLRTQMTADIAHDLRTPLHVMSGYIEAMRDGALPPTPERFDAMNQEANLLKRLIEDLRTLSLADSHALKLQYQTIQPQELLQQVKETFESIAGQQNVELRVVTDDDVPSIQVDRERMIQVLSNLVSNALRYTPSGGNISLSTRTGDKGVQFIVQDTGSGIRQEDLENIFERFYRVDKARHEVEGESGLGLAIVKSIVEAHEGTIDLSSAIGQGTRFIITLPLFRDT